MVRNGFLLEGGKKIHEIGRYKTELKYIRGHAGIQKKEREGHKKCAELRCSRKEEKGR
jgi:hypothetical protein